MSQSVHQMLLSVTTGQPTVAGVVPKGKKQRGEDAWRKQRQSELRKEGKSTSLLCFYDKFKIIKT